MELHRDDNELIAELRALRPIPHPVFAAELDERAAAGFPRAGRWPSLAFDSDPNRLQAFSRALSRLQAVPRRRLLAPGGAVALAAIAVATAVVVTSEGGPTPTSPPRPQPMAAGTTQAAGQSGAGAEGSLLGLSRKAVPAGLQANPGSSGATAGHVAVAPSAVEPFASSGPGPYASHVAHRDVERTAQIALAARPADVRDDAAQVFEAVHAYHGIVLSSSVREGAPGEAGANFDLLIPSGRLADAMAALSAIAEVRSRHESTADVTAPAIALGERLRDARATISSLLAQLAGAETEAERAILEARLHGERQTEAVIKARLAALRRRTHLSGISLRIESGGDAGNAGSGWGFGSALGDAGRILSVAAGVTLIGLAVLAPLALILLLAWLAQRAWIRRSRQHALG